MLFTKELNESTVSTKCSLSVLSALDDSTTSENRRNKMSIVHRQVTRISDAYAIQIVDDYVRIWKTLCFVHDRQLMNAFVASMYGRFP